MSKKNRRGAATTASAVTDLVAEGGNVLPTDDARAPPGAPTKAGTPCPSPPTPATTPPTPTPRAARA